jgi:hypothetical protein
MLRLAFGNKRLKDWLSAWNTAAKKIVLILDVCVLPLNTTANPQKLLIAWYNPMMAIFHN